MATQKEERFEKTMQMGQGEAVLRLVHLEFKKSNAIATEVELAEHQLILDALNLTKLDLGFDCNMDGVPDTIAIFAQSAKTSCCRILPTKSSRRKATTRKKKTSSRRKAS